MANTYVFNGQALHIIALDSDWLSSTHWTKTPPKVKYIAFIPAAAGDSCIIRQNSITGPVIFDSGIAQAGFMPVKWDIGEIMQLALDFSEGVYNASARVVIVEDRT